MTAQHPLLKSLCDKGLTVDESMELVQYCLQELGKHAQPSPETLERLANLEATTHFLKVQNEGMQDVVTFVRSIMKNEEWWEGAKQRATTLISRGRYVGTIIFSIIFTLGILKGWWVGLVGWTISELPQRQP